MNENYPMNQMKLKEILQKIHPDWDEYKVDDLAETTMRVVDSNRDGQLDLHEFRTWHLAHLEQTARLLDFAILPPEVKVMDDELPIARMMAEHDLFHKLQAELARKSGDGSAQAVSQSIMKGEPVGDHVLRVAAERLVGRDWMMLSNHLNFTVADVDAIASLHNEDLQKILTILKTWRDRDRGYATVEALEQALIASNMPEVAGDVRAAIA